MYRLQKSFRFDFQELDKVVPGDVWCSREHNQFIH